MNRLSSLVFLTALLLPAGPARSQEVYRDVDRLRPFPDRFEGALRAAEDRSHDAFWIAYSVTRMMREDSWTGHFHAGWDDEPALQDVLAGVDRATGEPVSLKETARRALKRADHEVSDRLVEKQIVILTRYRGASVEEVDMTNIELAFDLEEHPVYWLGQAADGESVAHLERLYRAAEDAGLREDLVNAVGMHETYDLVRPFLLAVVESSAPEDARESAIFWLSRDDTGEMARRLARLAEDDRSGDVREAAVFALSRMPVDAALVQLIRLARQAKEADIRETARFWLAEKASAQLLGKIDGDDESSELQKQAVFALAQMDDDSGVEGLIDLVRTHTNPVVRKEALFWLGQSDDVEALDAIVAILRTGS